MKCGVCGGELYFDDGIAICQSCKSHHKIDSIFENIEVYICYIESDANGRRTKDSLIAQEIYQNLESKNINTFFERVSASNATSGDLELLRRNAINNSKVIIAVGSSKENFEIIVEKFAEMFTGKIIIPFYADITPKDIPQSISKIQALNYDSIGWNIDLIKGVLNVLGREKEIEIKKLYSKSKIKKILISVIVSALALFIGIGLFLILGKKKPDKETQPLTNQQIYEQAQNLTNDGKYIDACDLYYQIIEYKNSKKLIASIYDKYDGYYFNDKEKLSLTLNINGVDSASIILEKQDKDNKIVRLEENGVMNKKIFEADFIDTLTNTGHIKVKLLNDAIYITINTNEINSSLNFGNMEFKFSLSSKTDKSNKITFTNETVLSWLQRPTSITDLKNSGYELVSLYTFDATQNGNNNVVKLYGINGQNIKLMASNFDLSKTGEFFSDANEHRFDDEMICAAVIPADIALPNEIGKIVNNKETENLIYISNVTDFSQLTHYEGMTQSPEDVVFFEFDTENLGTPINNNTLLGVVSKTMVGDAFQKEEIFEYINGQICDSKIEKEFNNDVRSNDQISITRILQNENKALYCAKSLSGNLYYYYAIDKSTYAIKFLIKIENDATHYSLDDVYNNSIHRENIMKYPEIFGKFLIE